MEVRIFTPDFEPRGVLPTLGGQAVLRNNNVSTFSVDVNGNSPVWNRLDTGWHVALYDDGQQLLAGTPDKITYKAAKGIRDVTVSGQSHMRYLRDMITLPLPGSRPDSQSEAYYKDRGAAGAVISRLVRSHVGQSARPENRSPVVVPDSSRGGQVTVNSRFQNLLDEIRVLAEAGKVTVGTEMVGRQVRLWIREGVDLGRAVRISEANAALESYEHEITAPTVTRVLVAGQGQGAARTLKLMEGNSNEWGVNVLQFQDRRDTDDIAELEQAGTDTLREGQESASIKIEAVDLPHLRFGHDYRVGDIITVEVGGRAKVTDVLQTAELSWDGSGRSVKLQVGPVQEDLDAPKWVEIVHRLRRDLGRRQND